RGDPSTLLASGMIEPFGDGTRTVSGRDQGPPTSRAKFGDPSPSERITSRKQSPRSSSDRTQTTFGCPVHLSRLVASWVRTQGAGKSGRARARESESHRHRYSTAGNRGRQWHSGESFPLYSSSSGRWRRRGTS